MVWPQWKMKILLYPWKKFSVSLLRITDENFWHLRNLLFFTQMCLIAIFEKNPPRCERVEQQQSSPRALQQSDPVLVPVHSRVEQDMCAGHPWVQVQPMELRAQDLPFFPLVPQESGIQGQEPSGFACGRGRRWILMEEGKTWPRRLRSPLEIRMRNGPGKGNLGQLKPQGQRRKLWMEKGMEETWSDMPEKQKCPLGLSLWNLDKTPEGLWEKKNVPIQEEGSGKEGNTWIAQTINQLENWVPESWRRENTSQVLGVEQVGNGERKEELWQARNTCTWWGERDSCAQKRMKFVKV